MSWEWLLVGILPVAALLWLLGAALLDTAWPMGSWRRQRTRRSASQFSLDAVNDLRQIVDILRYGVRRHGWANRTALLLSTTLRLNVVGHLLADQATSQVERFTGRSLLQLAEDMQAMPSQGEHLSLIGWHLDATVRAIEKESVSDLFQAVVMLVYTAHWPDEPVPHFSPRSAPALYVAFQQEFGQLLGEPSGDAVIDNAAFVDFLQRWRGFSLRTDTALFALVRALDAFRQPLFQLCHVGALSPGAVARLWHWVLAYLDGLQRGDPLAQYEALCFLITELQLMTEGESEDAYVVKDETRPLRLPYTSLPEREPVAAPLRRLQPQSLSPLRALGYL